MDLPTDQIQKYVSEAMVKNYECEMVINKNAISLDGFNRMLRYVKNHYTIVEEIHRESLDIRTKKSDIRVSLKGGKDDVLEYCRTNTTPLSNVIVVNKRRVDEHPPILIEDYDIRMNMNHEEDLSEEIKSEYMSSLRGKEKYYRYKKRYSFVDDSNSIRIDMSVVKSSFVPNAKSLTKSKTLSNVDEYEVEIEVLNSSKETAKDITSSITTLTHELLKLNNNMEVVLSKSKKNELLVEYVTLVDKNVDLEYFMKNKTKHFLRYQPITLMRRNLLNPNVDVVSIQKEYSCTEKADGERYLMFIAKDGYVYFMNNRLTLYPTGLKHPSMRSCLLDGEYITKGKLNTKLDLYMCFDCYCVNGKDVREKDLPTRLDNIKMALKDWDTSKPIIKLKEFFYGSTNIMVDTQKCLDRSITLPYHTDGLIYTPLYLSPGALYTNDTSMSPFGGTWNKVFKWKPPEENTIDVLVKFGDECVTSENGIQQKCMYADMFVAYRGSPESTVNVLDMYSTIDDKKAASPSKMINRLYDFTYLPIEGNNKHPLTTFTREPITNDVIVEMAYSPNSKYTKWTPLRLRKDKTAVMKQTNSIENAANNYNTVMNVWLSISDPVTKEMLTGKTPLVEEEVKTDNQDLYYARETPRNRSMLRPMLDFHNFWVKKKNLFDLFGKMSYRLLEIGCGQAGDLPKWIDNQFSQIVGVDNNEDNLLNSNHGAYKRVVDNLSSLTSKSKFNIQKQSFIFLLLDGGVKWSPSMIESIQSEEFAYLTQVAMGTIDKKKIKNKQLQKCHNSLNEPFDVVSCQFAVHYFFKSMDTLDAFCYNLNNHLKVNGYFVGCCLDGHLVNDAFVKEDSLTLQGTMNNKVLWQIEKKYDTFERNSTDSENLGKQIDVYVETINQIIPEYLVDFELFKRKLSEYNIKLVDVSKEKTIAIKTKVSSGSFEMLWDDMVLANKRGYKHWAVANTVDGMTEVMKRYSFMNRWFVFKKNNPNIGI